MGKTRPILDDKARHFIEAQTMFFVATAPLDAAGHVNLSPKGLDTFRILSPSSVAYIDFNGSGVETIAHLKENGRIVLMFCAFQGPPNIFRLYGRGRVIEPHQSEFSPLAQNFPPLENVRSIIAIGLERVSDSCGYGVPLFKFEGERQQLQLWASKLGPEGLQAYRERKNERSIDGLPGLSAADHNQKEVL
jgi:hypothetical protein